MVENHDEADRRSGQDRRSTPDITKLTRSLEGPVGAIAFATTGLLLLAMFYTLYIGREFFLPLTIAIFLNFLLTPAVRWLKGFGIPPPVGAGVMLLLFLGLTAVGIWRVWNPAMDWLERAPRNFAQVEDELRSLREPVEAIREAGDQVEALARGDEGNRRQQPPAESQQQRGLSDQILDSATQFVAGGAISLFLLYFLLALDDLFLRKLSSVLPTIKQRRKAVRIARATEHDLSAYVAIRTLVNIGFGAAVGVALWLVGMPNPVLWGIMAALLNYIPYLGGLIGYIIVGFVALTEFETSGQALLAPGVYFLLNIIEGNFITPSVLGRRLTVNPVMILVWLIFWGWIWGIPGALLAIPLLTMTKIVADNIETLAPLGEFLGR